MSTRRGSKNSSSQDFDPTPSLGKTIQRLRKAYNMSLGDLSEHSGVAKSIISQIERNETNPTLSTVYRLSRALDTTIDEVLRTEGAALFLEHQTKSGVPILDIADLPKAVKRDGVSIAVLAVPASSAQKVADLAVASGIKAILIFIRLIILLARVTQITATLILLQPV